ncbi:MAG: DNA polymerase-3 subunit epsilon [Sulfurimonas sp.]|jgi:DNA polymerase-3 subunit epsilon|uniref:3'-5' exonuclease n=1 Tax=Sulfurimonas sp. TaxID=2022749 RepID=UPI0039E676B3
MLANHFPLDEKSISRLSTRGLPLEKLKEQINDSLDYSLELWRAQGLDIVKSKGYYYFGTKFLPLEKAEFCIVDIETNGSKIDKHQIIEIAGVKIKYGKITEEFESLVHCTEINSYISDITGITVEDTKDAPSLKSVLYEFKQFLGDAIFIAHDVKFDYRFISLSLEKIGLEPLLNRNLCSLALAERSLTSYRYGLSYLNDTFNLNPNPTHHRAMSDVITTYGLFKLSLESMNENVNNVEDLIKFSKTAPRKKRPKFDPFLEEKRLENLEKKEDSK